MLFNLFPLSHSDKLEIWLKRWLPPRAFAQFVRLKTAQIYLKQIVPPHPDQFLVTDPSEAVRSSEILPVLQNYFTIEKRIPQGGTLVQPLFGRTVANFIQDKEGKDWARQILEDERLAIEQGTLPSDFIALMAQV